MTATKLPGGRMRQADYEISRQAARVPPKTTLEDVLQPGYWQNYNLDVGTEVTVFSENYDLDVRLRVLATDRLRTKMRVLDVYAAPDEEYNPEEASTNVDGLEIKWGGPNGKYRVIMDGEVLESGIATKEEAQERLEALAAG